VAEKVAIVADAAGERIDRHRDEHPHLLQQASPTTGPAAVGDRPAVGVDEEMIATSPFALIGSHSARSSRTCSPMRERYGFSYVIVGGDEIESFAPSSPNSPG
jgi:hypothetical protein